MRGGKEERACEGPVLDVLVCLIRGLEIEGAVPSWE